MLSVSDLTALHATPAPAAPAPAPAPRGLKPNAYAGDCIKCSGRVGANAGLRDRQDGKWVVRHIGACPAPAPVAAPVATPVVAPLVFPTPTVPAIWDGDYTIETPSGHRTFQIETQADDADFAPGKSVISFLSGRDNETDFTRFGFVVGKPSDPKVVTWKKHRDSASLAADVALFLRLWVESPDEVLVAKRCLRCHAKLTTPESIAAGLGPVCITR